MNIAEFFIRRPVMTVLVMLALLFFGIMGYRLLPVSDLPNVDFPTILVTVNLPGASPETMASSVATPLERQFSTISGVDSMTSTNALGITLITLQFSLSRNIDAAAQDVQAMITKASTQLPPDLPTPPSYQKVNPADLPVIYLSLNSPTLPLSVVNEYADTFIAPRISMINGVAQVLIYGAQKFAVRIQLDPQALATRSIGIDEVSGAVQKGNVNLPTGTLWGTHQAVTLQANGQLMEAEAYRPLIVAYRNGSPVRLQEIGRVINSVENDRLLTGIMNPLPLFWPFNVSQERTPLKWLTPSRNSFRASGPRCPPLSTSRSSTTGLYRSEIRSAMSSSPCFCPSVWSFWSSFSFFEIFPPPSFRASCFPSLSWVPSQPCIS